MKKYLSFLLIKVCFFGFLSAQESPEAVAEKYWQLLKDGKYEESASLFAPSAVADFREMMSFYEAIPEADASEFLTQFFGEGITKDSLDQMNDTEFFQSFMGNMYSLAGGMVNFNNMEIIGTIAEGQDTTHVLTRMYIETLGVSSEKMQVLSLQKSGDTWGILLEGRTKGIAQQLKKAYEARD